MLNLMRKHARNWLMKLLLGIIIVVFIFYFGSISEKQKAETIAFVGGKPISHVDFQKTYENLLELIRQQSGGNLPPEILKGLNLKQQALDRLINEEIMVQKAAQLGIEVTDEEIKDYILNAPPFQINGVFDERLYRQTLQMNRMTPETFEAAQRRGIMAAKMGYLIQDTAKASDEEAYDLYRLQNEQIAISYLQIPAANFREKVKPAQEAIEAFLKERSAEFRVPEQIRVGYLTFSGDDFSAAATMRDEDITDYYERNKERWTKGGKPPSLPEVKDKIIAELKQITGMRKAAEEAKKAHDTIYQEDNFEAYAAKNGLKIRTTDFFTAKNLPPEFRQIGDFAESVFSLKNNETSGVLKSEKAFILVKLMGKKEAYTPALKDIAPAVEQRYREQEAVRLAAQAAESVLARLKKGESMERVAAENGLKINETEFFLPGSPVPKLGSSPALNAALFQVSEKNPYPDRVADTGGSFTIVRFKARKNVDRNDFAAKKQSFVATLRELNKNEIVKSWIEGTKAAMLKDGTIKITKESKDL